MKDETCLDIIVFITALVYEKCTPYEFFCEALEYESKITKDVFNATFSRMVNAGILIKQEQKFGVSKEFSDFFESQDETINPEHFSKFYPGYYSINIQEEYLDAYSYATANKEKPQKDKKTSRSTIFLLLGIVSAFVCFGLIFLVVQVDKTNKAHANILLILSLLFLIVSFACIMKWLSKYIGFESNNKKQTYTMAPIDNFQIRITAKDIENYFLDNKYQIYPERKILFKASKAVTKKIMKQVTHPKAFPFKMISINDDVEDINKEIICIMNFLDQHETFSVSSLIKIEERVRHRIVIIFLFKENVTNEDLVILEECYEYEKVGELFLCHIPIYFPVLYDKSKNTLIYKAAKIPSGFGSTLHVILKELKKMLKKI